MKLTFSELLTDYEIRLSSQLTRVAYIFEHIVGLHHS